MKTVAEQFKESLVSEAPRRRKTGGRKKGTPNKRTQIRREMIGAVLASGKDPMTFFAEILRNEDNPLELRFEAASELMPYRYPKLASVEARQGGKTHEQRVAEYYALMDDDAPREADVDERRACLSKKNGAGVVGAPFARRLRPKF